MLETVQANDTAVLDEIDALYWCAENEVEFVSITMWNFNNPMINYSNPVSHIATHLLKDFYTRSRDVLKLERPDGWFPQLNRHEQCNLPSIIKPEAYTCGLWHPNMLPISTPRLPAEELAEFHAIIQAKIWMLENE